MSPRGGACQPPLPDSEIDDRAPVLLPVRARTVIGARPSARPLTGSCTRSIVSSNDKKGLLHPLNPSVMCHLSTEVRSVENVDNAMTELSSTGRRCATSSRGGRSPPSSRRRSSGSQRTVSSRIGTPCRMLQATALYERASLLSARDPFRSAVARATLSQVGARCAASTKHRRRVSVRRADRFSQGEAVRAEEIEVG